MAKTQILDYYIHLTDKATVDRYNDQLAAIGTVTASPDGVGSPLLYIPSTGKYAILRAPDAAATEFSAPKQAENVTFAAPCTRSHWFIPGTNNFPTNVATFTRKSGGWFGIPALFGSTTKFYWAGHFVYAPAATNADLEDGSGVAVTVPAPMPTRIWIHGFELPDFGEGIAQSQQADHTPEAARFADGGYGFSQRYVPANSNYVRHQIPTVPAQRGTWERFYFRPRKFPAVTTEIWSAENFSQSGSRFSVRIMPTGQLAFYSSVGINAEDLVATGGQLALNTWARIDTFTYFFGADGPPELRIGILEVYLNGVKLITHSMAPGGIASNIKHVDSYLGRTKVVGSTGESDFDDWRGAQIPQNMNTLNADWSSATAYAIGDVVNWDPATPLGFGHRAPSAVRGFVYKAKTNNTNKQPDTNAADWDKLGDSPDWLSGSRCVIIRPTGDAADRLNWTGDWRMLLQRPHGGWDDITTSSTAGAIMSVTTDAADIHKIPGARGIAGFVFGLFGAKNLSAVQGTLGYKLNGGAEVMAATVLDQLNPVWNALGYFPANLAAPQALTSLELRMVKGGDALEMRALSMHAVAEVIGIFGPEDVPAGTVDVPTFPIERLGQHNRWYPRSPWAANTSRAHSPVVIDAGTYVGAGTGKDLFFRVPPHLIFIRRVTGVNDRWSHWWASMLGSHINFEEAMQPAGPVHVRVDPTFVPVGGEDDQAQRYVARIAGNGDAVNTPGATYQYFAVCDPAARFLLTGSFNHDEIGTLPVTETLADPNFTPEAGFFFPVTRTKTSTLRMGFKGIGHAANAAIRLPSTADSNYATFGAGSLTVRAGLLAAGFEQISYALFRRDDGNADPNRYKLFSLLTWTGDGAASRSISPAQATGLRPLWAMATGDGSVTIVRDPAHTGTNSTDRASGSHTSTGITAGGIDTVTVGSGLNTNGTLYNMIVFWGSATAGNNGWSINGEFIPVEPDSVKPPTWAEPVETPISFVPAPPPTGTGPGIGDGPTLDPPDLTDDLADSACVAPTTKVANLALSRIGINKEIGTLLTEQSAEAQAARLHYDLSLQATLRDRPWPFATRYATLTLLAGSVASPANADWTFAYRLPDNCAFPRRLVTTRGVAVDPTPPPFREGGGVLFTNEASAKLEYTARVHCPSRVSDATFLNAWAWRLAHEIAVPLTRMPDRAQHCWDQYQAALATADTFLRLGSPGPRPAADPNDPDALCASVKLRVINIGLVRIGAQTIADLGNEQSREAVAASLVYEDELKATLRDFPWAFATRYVDPLTLARGPAWADATVQAWSSTQAYVAGDTVKQAGTVYYCVLAHTNQVPPNATYWTTPPTTAANADWTYAYRLPSDSLMARRLVRRGVGRAFDPDPPQYRLGSDDAGGLIFADERDPVLEYTVRPKCALSIGDALFRDAFAWRIAAVLAPSLAAVEPEAPEQTGRTPEPSTPKRSEGGALRLQQLREQRAKWAWAMYQRALLIAEASNANEQQQERTDEGDADWIRGR